MSVPRGRYTWKEPGAAGRVLRVLVVVTGVLALLGAITLALVWDRGGLVFRVPGPGDPDGTVVFPFGQMRWFGLLWIPSLVSQVTIVVWLVWQHQATANLWARGLTDLRTTPGWAVGWWMIPVAWYVMPFLAVRELDERSTLDGTPRRTSPLLWWWWGAWLAAQLLPLVGFVGWAFPSMSEWTRTFEEGAVSVDLAPLLRPLLPWVLIAGALQAVAGIFASQVVGRIEAGQRAMASWPATPPRPDLG